MTAERGKWGSQLQFLLSCIGFSVGLGNLWRFPGVAYENGGGAFLIPYLTFSLLVGQPCLYLEFFIGQFTQSGCSTAFRLFKPAFHGIGYTMTIAGFCVGIYYNMIIAWCLLYLFDIVTGQSWKWTSCGNSWNTMNCSEVSSQSSGNNSNAVLPAEEYFNHHLLEMSTGITDTGEFSLRLFLSLSVVWTLTALCLCKGVALIGKISYVTATLPYIIIGILFIRGVTLDGATTGLNFYLFHPDFSRILEPKTWTAAATQLCFSLSTGFGGLLSMASYNARDQNCFKDALVVIFCDSFMSVFGGCAVFSTIGFLSHKTGRDIKDLVGSATGIAFVAYPEAISQMVASPFFAFLLFFMFFLLGISSQFGLTQSMVTAILDQFPSLRRHHAKVVIIACLFSFIVGLSMCFQSGYYWFNLYNEWIGAAAVLLMLLVEIILVVHLYGIHNLLYDIRSHLGPQNGFIGRWFGPSGYLLSACWLVVTPSILSILIYLTIRSQLVNSFTAGDYVYPSWAKVLGFFIQYSALLAIPLFFLYNFFYFQNRQQSWTELFRVQPKLPSYSRLRPTNTIHPVRSSQYQQNMEDSKRQASDDGRNISI